MKIIIGKVISKKMDKTATVAVERIVVHPLYRKRFKKIRKYNVHDETGVGVGQIVKFVASKPYSKLKRWKIIEVVQAKNKKPTSQRTQKGKLKREQKKIEGTEKSVPSA